MENFAEKRLEICRNCPICKIDSEIGMKCDERKWISPDGTQGSFFKKDGWKKGCGCVLQYKVRNINKHCVIGKW